MHGKAHGSPCAGEAARAHVRAVCVPVTCECRCAQACAFPKCVPRPVGACGSCWRTGSTRAHGQAAGTHLRTGVSTRRQVRGEPNLRLRARSRQDLLRARRAKGSGSGGGLEAGAGTSAPAQMSAAARAGVPTEPRPTPAARASHTPAYVHIAQVKVTDLTLPHPSSARATCSTAPKRARRRASYRHSLALNLCSGQDVSVVLSFPSQCQPHEMFVHWGHLQSLKSKGKGHLPSAAQRGSRLEDLCMEQQ